MRAVAFVGNLIGAGLAAIAIGLAILIVGIPIAFVIGVIVAWLGLA